MKAVSDNALVSYSKEPHFTHNLNSLIPFMQSEAFCFIRVSNIKLKSCTDIEFDTDSLLVVMGKEAPTKPLPVKSLDKALESPKTL